MIYKLFRKPKVLDPFRLYSKSLMSAPVLPKLQKPVQVNHIGPTNAPRDMATIHHGCAIQILQTLQNHTIGSDGTKLQRYLGTSDWDQFNESGN